MTAKTLSLEFSLKQKMSWAGKTLNLDADFITKEVTRFKYRELTLDRIRIVREDGSYESVSVIVVLHYNPYPGDRPYKGGMRMGTADIVSPDKLRGFAMDMTAKCGLTDLEFGGAKSGILLPRPIIEYAPIEIERIFEAVAVELIDRLPIIRPHFYVPATDLNTTSIHMDLIYNKFWELTKGSFEGTPVTGQSERHGGLPVRTDATGLGGFIVLEQIMQSEKFPKTDPPYKVIVQGTGQVGSSFLRQLIGASVAGRYLVVGVSNAVDAVYNPNGINVAMLPKNKEAAFEEIEGEHCSSAELLQKPCDILVPAAVENVLTHENAGKIQAKVILELANHPTTDAADEILRKNGKFRIPDILGNVGGVTASFVEWTNSFGRPHHKIEVPRLNEEAKNLLIEVVQNATIEVMGYANWYETDLRGAAWLKAMRTLADASHHKHPHLRRNAT